MTLKDWLTLRFPLYVCLDGKTSPDSFLADLQGLTAPRFATAKAERRKPLRGVLSGYEGKIRWPLNEYRFVSPRSLHFMVSQDGEGTKLEGEFVVWLGFRVIVLSWLCLGVGANLWEMFYGLSHGAGWGSARLNLLFVLICVAMAYGYTVFCIAVGRRRDRDLLRVLTSVLRSPEAAEVVRDLLVR